MLKAYLVGGSQDTQGRPDQLLAKVEVALQNGITMFQYREKGPGALTGGARIQLGHRLRALCRQYDCPFVVDDDLALASELGRTGFTSANATRELKQCSRPPKPRGSLLAILVQRRTSWRGLIN